jgi:uncharacterized protein
MTPFYFGAGERRLFGIYDPAPPGSKGDRAAVLCYPWGSEYLHAHRAMRQLGTKLTRAGFHTLRFDYFGTGDSAGEMIEATLKGWEADIESAIDEVKDMTRVTRVAVIGLRLGATLAATVAAKRPEEVNALVLWDPVVSGEEYLKELGPGSAPAARSAAETPAAPPEVDRREINGFLLTPEMAREFQAIDLRPVLPALSARTLIITTALLPSHDALYLLRASRGAESSAIEHMADISPWIEDRTKTGALPVTATHRIVQWLA